MHTRFILLCICLLALCPVMLVAGDMEELQHIRLNYVQALLSSERESNVLTRTLTALPPESEVSDQMVAELHQRYPLNVDGILVYVRNMRPDGSWPDINYADTRRSGWEPKQHAERVLEMTKWYGSTGTSHDHSVQVEKAIRAALHYWFIAKPVSQNWWQNQIGIPKTLGAAFILFEEKLTAEERADAIEVMQQAKFGMTGQNKVWLAGNVLIRALLQNDFQLVKAARDTIASEIVTGQAEGVKEDWSFHQHGPQQQFGNYGLAFVSGMSFYAGLFSGTSLAFDERQLDILASLLERGYRWILWNGYMDISSLDRQLYHNAPLHKALGVGFAAASLARSGSAATETAYKHITDDNFLPRTGTNPFTGHKHFPCSDYTIHRTPHWMASVKMASTRVVGTELVNEDNLKGYYMADGATYFYTRGDEYLNDFPFWDWRKIPGITSYDTDAPLPRKTKTGSNNQSAFVGGVGDGRYGLTAMELNRDGLRARKAWVFADDFVLCLGAGIESDTLLPVVTAIDQRSRQGDLFLLESGRWNAVNGKKQVPTGHVRLFHDNTGYILLGENTCVAETATRRGQWHDFMQMYGPRLLTGDMITLYLTHGTQPQGGAYQYFVVPASDKERTAAFDTSRVRVLQNDARAQIVSLPESGIYFAVVYEGGLRLGDLFPVSAEKPGLYLAVKGRYGYQMSFEDLSFRCFNDLQ